MLEIRELDYHLKKLLKISIDKTIKIREENRYGNFGKNS
jgi:hypothetical protein